MTLTTPAANDAAAAYQWSSSVPRSRTRGDLGPAPGRRLERRLRQRPQRAGLLGGEHLGHGAALQRPGLASTTSTAPAPRPAGGGQCPVRRTGKS